MATIDGILKLLRPLQVRIANMIARSIVRMVNDADGVQVMQIDVLAGETRDGIERMQEYGFTSVPLPGAEALAVFVGGRRDHGLVVGVEDRRHRLAGLASGEVAIYNNAGSSIVLRANGDIEIGAGANVILNGGQAPVARVGDTAGPYPIVGGAPAVKA